ncbi:MAG: YrzE family protein [Erysipelotrichaceae bacterium]|nr:YrzE family protein [Erysipelotrichaceae bacterium]
MASMQALLERDKERFLNNMAAAKASAESVSAVEEQLNRILLAYNEEEENERIRNTAVCLIESLSSAAGFLNCDGESTIWSKSQYRPGISKPKRSAWFIIFLLLGILCLAAACAGLIYFTDAWPPTNEMIIGLSVAGIAALLLFLSGIFSARKKEENRQELYAETIPDGEKTYHILLNSVLTADKILEGVRNEELLENKKALLEERDELKKEDIQLFSELLESAYAEMDNEYSKQIISEVKFYLHRKKIDVVDYDGNKRELFELMPSEVSGTIRPALVIGGTVLRKGLAAGE